MSPADDSPTAESPPSDIWAGKSRNAKAQARHRAKRKAYIEQLEHTVSKLQAALALSTEDIADLPTPQAKLRELKEENDSLRAQIRKLQSQSPPTVASSSNHAPLGRIPMQMHSPTPSEDNGRISKRQKISPAVVDDYVPTNLSYLGSGSMSQASSIRQHSSVDSPQTTNLMPTVPLPKACYQPYYPTPQHSPVEPLMHPPRQTVPTSLSSHQNNVAAPWPLLSVTHHRQRSSSGSSASSGSGPPNLIPEQMSLAASYKPTSFIDDDLSYSISPKMEDGYQFTHGSNASYGLPNGLPISSFEPIIVPPSPPENQPWDPTSWSYSDVRTQ